MMVLLDLLYLLAGLLIAPLSIVKMALSARWRTGLLQRLGGVPIRDGDRRCVWVHAVSVGEVNAARPLIELLEREHPELDVRLSTTTDTGQRVARKLLGDGRCFYYPLDFSRAVARTFRRVRPDLVVLVELELWPNFVRVARRSGVPIVVVNGRMREPTMRFYRRVPWLFRPAFDPRSGNAFCVQNQTYRDRFLRAGAPETMLHVTGNMKYDAVRTRPEPEASEPLRGALGISEGERAWVAACTWPGEEAICLRVHRRLLEREPRLRLVIAPRHVERVREVERCILSAGFKCRRASSGGGPTGPDTVGLLDTIGTLGYCYDFAEFAFIGRSLVVGGGHNMLEPAALGVLPVFGPHTENFDEEARLLLDNDAAVRVADEAELATALARLLEDAADRERQARRAREVVLARRGAARRHLEMVLARLPEQTKGAQPEDAVR